MIKDNKFNNDNYFIAQLLSLQAIGQSYSEQTNFVNFDSVDPILNKISSDITLSKVLDSTAILDNIINNINNSSNNIDIQYKSSNSHYAVLKASIQQCLSTLYVDINNSLSENCSVFFEDDDVYNIFNQFFNTTKELTQLKNPEDPEELKKILLTLGYDFVQDSEQEKQYTEEQLEDISKLSIDELAEQHDNLEITDVIQDACDNAQFLYPNINISYKNLAKIMLEGIILKYNRTKGKINNYNDFLEYVDTYFMGISNSDFIKTRRIIIDKDLDHIDPIVEYTIGTYIKAEFPIDQFQECNLRKTCAVRVDEALAGSDTANEHLNDCKNYIKNASKSNNNGFIDIILNGVLQRHSEYIADNIQRQSFADFINKKDLSNKEPISEPEKSNVKVNINDPSTWDINTLINQLGASNVNKIISDNIESILQFFPVGKINNKKYFDVFIDAIRTWVSTVLKDNSNIIQSIKNKEDLIKRISQAIDDLNDTTIINIRNAILNEYYNGKEPKINLIIGKFNNELKKKFNTKINYLEDNTPLYSNLLNYLKSDIYKNQINKAFVDYFKKANNKDKIIYSIDTQKNIRNIHYMYIKFFPSILIDDLYSKDIRTLSYMFSDEELNKVIENNLQDTENLFLPKNDEYYREFTQLLIQNLLSNFATVAKDNGRIKPLYELFGDLRKKYNDLLDGNLNSRANEVRATFFGYNEKNKNELKRKISDPFILNILMQLFPDLDDIDTQSPIAQSLAKYIFITKGNDFIWKNLKSYFQKITSSVFHANYTDIDSVCYNTVFLNAIKVLQIEKSDYYNIQQFRSKIESGQKQDTSLPISNEEDDDTSIDTDISIDTNISTDTDNHIDISNWTLDQLNDKTNNKISDILNLESSFLPEKLLLQFCNIIIKNICVHIKDLNITSQAQLLDVIKQIYNRLATYKAFINIRDKLLLRSNIDIDPFVTNINKQLSDFNLQKITINSDLYNEIIQQINTNLFQHFLKIIGNKYIFNINNELYRQHFPNLFTIKNEVENSNNDSNTNDTVDKIDKTNEKDKSEEKLVIDDKPVIKNNNDDKQIKPGDKIDKKDKDKKEPKKVVVKTNNDKSIVNDDRDKQIIHKTNDEISGKVKIDIDKKQVKPNSRLKELRKNNDELQSYTLDNYTINELEQLIHSYKSSFNIDNEIIKAAVGHIESFNGESYKRIFKPLFEGTFAKQLPTKKFAKELLKKVQLTALITNERHRFAEFLRIFLFNISDKNHKFFIHELTNQKNIFNKQIKDYLLYNTNITDKINQRLYWAFDKYYNAYFDNELDNEVYDMAFDNLAKANSIEDTKGDVHQFKDYSLKNKVLIVNDQAYIFNANKSFEEYLHSLNIQESIYNYAQGYIIKNCVFLDPLVNCSEEEATNILMNDLSKNIKKVYLTINNDDNILTERRLAKLINVRGIYKW